MTNPVDVLSVTSVI